MSITSGAISYKYSQNINELLERNKSISSLIEVCWRYHSFNVQQQAFNFYWICYDDVSNGVINEEKGNKKCNVTLS